MRVLMWVDRSIIRRGDLLLDENNKYLTDESGNRLVG
jgi:hypothetical protein